MIADRESRCDALQLDTLLHQLVDAGACIVALEKHVPVVGDQSGFVLRVTPGEIDGHYPGLTPTEFNGREFVVECTIDNYGVPLSEGPVDLLPVYVSDDVADPVQIEEGLENIDEYLGGDGA